MEIDLAALFSRYLPQSAAEPCPLSSEVETELFLIAPDAKHKDARVIRVTEDNCSECLTILKDSDVFEVGSLFRCYQFNPEHTLEEGSSGYRVCTLCLHSLCVWPSPDQLTLLKLVSELDTVVDWFHFGLYLGIPDHELLSIELQHQRHVQRSRTDMLRWWLQHGTERSWTSIVRALEGIKMQPLAKKIAIKHGMQDFSLRGSVSSDQCIES